MFMQTLILTAFEINISWMKIEPPNWGQEVAQGKTPAGDDKQDCPFEDKGDCPATSENPASLENTGLAGFLFED